MRWIKIGRDILALEVSLEEQEVPAPHQVPEPKVSELGREVSIASGCKNQQGLRLREKRGQEFQAVPLKGAHTQTYSLRDSLPLSSTAAGAAAQKATGTYGKN